MPKLRILVVDDHEVVRKGLRALLERRPEWKVCGEASAADEAIRKTRKLRPNVVLLDISLPDASGLDIISHLRNADPKTEILILTMHDSGEMATRALAAGASGLVLKSDASRDLVSALKAIAQHRRFLSPQVSEIIATTLAEHRSDKFPLDALTARQNEILKLLAEGRSTKEVATALGISSKTADIHRTHVMKRLGLHSQSELIFFAIRAGIVKL
jgi:DNA-binding NarL/FixJ family response regulator